MIISIVLLFLLVSLILCSIFLLCIGLFQYVIIPIFLLLIVFLLFRIWFYHRCRKFINLNRFIIKIETFINKKSNRNGYIVFNSHRGDYLCENNSIIEFKLEGFLLKKSFIRAFVVRQIRYKTISNNLKISKLFSNKLKHTFHHYDNLYLIIDKHKYLIYSNNISRNTFLSSEISRSKYASMYLSARSFFDCNVVEEINEKIYLDKYSAVYKNF